MLVNLLLAHSIWSLTSLGTISHGARKVYQPILGREHIGHLPLCHYRILVQSEYWLLPFYHYLVYSETHGNCTLHFGTSRLAYIVPWHVLNTLVTCHLDFFFLHRKHLL